MTVMKMKHTKETECRLRDVWDLHEFPRRDLKDKMQQSRLKMLMGASAWVEDPASDTGLRWW